VEKLGAEDMYGPFEVLERLGVGGMATVHRAIERGIAGFVREVALKRLLPHLAEEEQFVRAFVREAKIASLLQHGNIVQLYELGRVGPSYFISMEYIAGRDLRAAIRQARRLVGPPPIAITLAIVAELLDALDYAHNRCDEAGEPLGLVHRDISPSNLIINDSGHLKVIDFGVARANQAQLQTQTGGIKGKLSYLSPETLAGRVLDGRSDLFSASVILHELLTTAPLFTGESEFQTMDRVQRMAPPPPSARNRECPPELDAIVLKGLAKEPGRRWSSAAQMRAELAELAVRHRLHATSREVAGWIAWAFGPGAARRPLPLAAPEPTLLEAIEGELEISPVELEEEAFEAAWDWLRTGAAGVVLPEVPDVSDRLVAGSTNGKPEDDAPTMYIDLDRSRAPSVRAEDSVLALAGPESVSALSWAETFVSGNRKVAPRTSRDADPTTPFSRAALRAAREPSPPLEWADGTDARNQGRERDRLPLRAVPEPAAPRDSAPLTLSGKVHRWVDPDVRLRPSAVKPFLLFLLLSAGIAAATAFILRGDHPPVSRAPERKPPTAAAPPRPAPAAAPATSPHQDRQLVPPDQVSLRRGKPPVLRVAETGPTPAIIDAELCADRRGAVSSVEIRTEVSPAARAVLTRKLGKWRYHPIESDGHRVAGCFAVQVRPTLR
jgi:hypothetical protein